MAFGLDVRKDVADGPVGANDEGHAGDSLHLLAIHILFLDNAEFVADFLIGVAKKRIGQIVLGLEFLLSFRIIGGDAQNYGTGALQFFVRFAEPASFNGSAGSVGFRKEEENHGLVAELFQRDGVSVLVRQSELRSFIINLHG